MESRGCSASAPTGPRIGKAARLDDAGGRYVVFAKATFPRELTLDGVRVVVDAAHGAAYKVAPLVFSRARRRACTRSASSPNGRTSTRTCGALHPDNVRAEVVRAQAPRSASRSTATPTASS